MSERQRLMCLLIKTVPLPFRTLKVIANKLVDNGVTIPVRCKNCKNWNACGDGCGWCDLPIPDPIFHRILDHGRLRYVYRAPFIQGVL